jgi:hypothetical protein
VGLTGPGRCTAVEPDLGRGSGIAFVWSDLPGPRIIVVRGDETGFVTEGCFPWFEVSGPFAVRLATPGEPFGQGDYLVGSEVEPGTYEARTLVPMGENGWPAPCGWVRVVIDADLDVHFIEMGWARADGIATATIDASDTYFGSRNCDQWTRVG